MNPSTKRRWSTAALGVYWFALAVATHTPKTPELPAAVSDKLLHAAAYAVLAVLAALCLSNWKRVEVKTLAVLAGILSAYGIVDELLQIPVGRDADVVDWLYDTAGVIGGLFLFWISTAARRRQ